MNTRDQKQCIQNLLSQLKIATIQNKALKMYLFGENTKLSYQAGYIYQYFLFSFPFFF